MPNSTTVLYQEYRISRIRYDNPDKTMYRLVVDDVFGNHPSDVSCVHISDWDHRDDAVLYVHDNFPQAKSYKTLMEERAKMPKSKPCPMSLNILLFPYFRDKMLWFEGPELVGKASDGTIVQIGMHGEWEQIESYLRANHHLISGE